VQFDFSTIVVQTKKNDVNTLDTCCVARFRSFHNFKQEAYVFT